MRRWFDARRLWLKSRYVAENATKRLRILLRLGPDTIPLEKVQRRLELVLTGVYGQSIPIAPIERNVWDRERVRQFAKGDIRGAEATPTIDGKTIFLPAELKIAGNERRAVDRYRLFALEQAERIARGTVSQAPADPLERDLYLLREGASIDAHIARSHPGVTRALSSERESMMKRRPKLEDLTPAERDVEQMLRDTLKSSPEASDAPAPNPAASLAWATMMAATIRSRAGGRYRGLAPLALWGSLKIAEELPATREEELSKHAIGGAFDRVKQKTTHGESSEGTGDAENEEAKDPDEGDTRTPEGEEDIRREQEAESSAGRVAAPIGVDSELWKDTEKLDELPAPTYYDEWNADRRTYEKRHAAVRVYPAEEGDMQWVRETLRAHAATVRQVRQQFERLRARRALLSRQRAGDELDIRAMVDAFVDRRIGDAPDDRLYVDARPARRGLAIALLVDTSGSTEARVTDQWRIVDLEKIALLLATQALDALGDLYAVYAFAGKNAHNVKLSVVKDFAERSGETVQRRIAALEPGGFTRLGAAVRHATRQLARQSAGHRLLLLLSDGRPNDVDVYGSDYGVEDSRQAIFEARASGVYPFCLTIDGRASEYLPRIFGQAGHTILTQPRQLPTALLGVVRALIRT